MRSVRYISDTFQGTTHSENQDGLLVVNEKNYEIYNLFDGVSMSENQVRGVRMAIDFIDRNYRNFLIKEKFHLKEMIIQVNTAIVNSPWPDALTTYCAAVLWDDRKLLISHMGDSRIYTQRNNKLVQHTVDDVIYPGSNILTRCLGVHRLVDTDFYQKEIKAEKGRLLLCTDGFYELMERDSNGFIQIFNLPDLKTIKSQIHETISGRNRDDATYLLIDIN